MIADKAAQSGATKGNGMNAERGIDAECNQVEGEPGRKKRGPYMKPRERATAAALLIDAGMEPVDAGKQLGYSVKNNSQMLERLNRLGMQELLTKRRVNKALKVTDAFLDGRAIGEVTPNPSVTWQAAQAVIDRAYPKAAPEGSAPMTFTTVNIALIQPHVMQDTAETVVSPPVIELQPQ